MKKIILISILISILLSFLLSCAPSIEKKPKFQAMDYVEYCSMKAVVHKPAAYSVQQREYVYLIRWVDTNGSNQIATVFEFELKKYKDEKY